MLLLSALACCAVLCGQHQGLTHVCAVLRRAIVGEVVGLGVEDEDRRRTWMADAEEAARRGSIETARAIYNATLAAFPGKPAVWRAAAALEKQHGSRQALDELLKRAVSYCPQAEVLWLMAAKERWLAGGGLCCAVLLLLPCWRYSAKTDFVQLCRRARGQLLVGSRQQRWLEGQSMETATTRMFCTRC